MTGATMRILLGVDVGTTDSKVLVTTEAGAEVGLVADRTPWTVHPGGLTETDATLLADSVIGLMDRAVLDAAGRLGAVEVAGVAVTGMAETGVLVDVRGEPTHPAIAWFDPRGADEIAATPATFRDEFPGRTGLPVSALASVAKMLWLRAGGLPIAGRQWLGVPEFLVHRLGGQRAAELSLASRTGLLDQDGPALWDAALDILGAGPDLLPPLIAAGTPVGRVAAGRAPASLVGAALTVAGHDHLVASVGCGVIDGDELFDSFGTAEAMVRSVATGPAFRDRERLAALGINVVRHVLAGRSVLLGGTRAGLILRRTLELLGAIEGSRRAELDRAALAALTAPDRAADGIGRAAGVAVTGAAMDDGGLKVTVDGDGVGPAALWQAVLDCGTAEAERLLTVMAEFAGPVRRTVVAGGWARMASVRASRSLVFPRAEFSTRRQAGAFGAALFAGQAAAVADPMLAAGDPTAIGISVPTGPDRAYLDAFLRESASHTGTRESASDTGTHLWAAPLVAPTHPTEINA
jgi:sugar (pentulose or hexulose) kinase